MFSRQIFKPLQSTGNLSLLRPAIKPRLFSSTPAVMVKPGDAIPAVDLVEDSPGNLVNLHKELTGNGLIIGVPAAFSTSLFSLVCGTRTFTLKPILGPSCSNTHVPGFINHPKLKNAGKVFVVAVNDPFV